MILRVGQTRILVLAMLVCARGYGENTAQPPSEYQVKAAFLYNFVKFVEWPATPEEQTRPIELCVLGKDPFRGELQRAVDGKAVSGRSLIIRQMSEASAAQSCHVLFMAVSEAGRVADILKTVAAWNILTVSELDRFLDRGGMINFIMQGQRVRFEINPAAAVRARLTISSKLLQLGAAADQRKY
jgi:YfiR/HmsC-like